MPNSQDSGDARGLGGLIDVTVAQRTNLREGLRAMHRVRFVAYIVFSLVIFTTGPILGIDPITFTLQGMGICSLGAVSAWLVLRSVRRAPPREWMAYVAVPVDAGIITFAGFLMGGVSYTAQLAFFVVVVMHGRSLHPWLNDSVVYLALLPSPNRSRSA